MWQQIALVNFENHTLFFIQLPQKINNKCASYCSTNLKELTELLQYFYYEIVQKEKDWEKIMKNIRWTGCQFYNGRCSILIEFSQWKRWFQALLSYGCMKKEFFLFPVKYTHLLVACLHWLHDTPSCVLISYCNIYCTFNNYAATELLSPNRLGCHLALASFMTHSYYNIHMVT